MKSSQKLTTAIKHMTVGEFEDWMDEIVTQALLHAKIDPDPDFQLTTEEEKSLEEIDNRFNAEDHESLIAHTDLMEDLGGNLP